MEPNFKEAKAFKHFFIARKLDAVDYSEAIKEYSAAIELCPDIATFHNNLGLIYYYSKNYTLSEKKYFTAIEINPNCILAYSNLCLLYYATGKYIEGVSYGRKAVELLRPTTPEETQAMAYNNLSMCLWKTKQTEEAIEMVKKAIALEPQTPLYRNNLISYKLVNNKYRKLRIILYIAIFSILFVLWFISLLFNNIK